MDVAVDAAGGQDFALTGNDFGARSDDNIDVRLNVGIAGFTDFMDPPVQQRHIGLDDAPMVDDQRVGDHGVHRALRVGGLGLAHAVADYLAAAKSHFLAIGRQVAFHLHHQAGIGQTHPVTGGGAEHVGIGTPRDAGHQRRSPMILPRKPKIFRAPRYGTSTTLRVWPGSKRTAVPAAISSRLPRA